MSTPVGPYTPVVQAGNLVVCSGQVGLVPGESGPTLADGFEAQVRQSMENVATVLGQKGVGWPDVFKTLVFLTDMTQYSTFNSIYTEMLGDHRPARSLVTVAALPVGALVEIEAWAISQVIVG
jgi:2-iminobutanoate/2-iminopropanoate deaminase